MQNAVAGLGQAVPPGLGLAGLQTQLTHQGTDGFGAAGDAVAAQVGVDTPIAVGAVGGVGGVGGVEKDTRCSRYLFAAASSSGLFFPSPFLVPRSGYVEPYAHARNG